MAVTGDTLDENSETFVVDLSTPTNATLADSQGQATITDDDGPTIAIGDATVTEGNTGSVNAVFTVTLSASSPQEVTVAYATANGPVSGGATQPADYTAASGTLTFAASETSKEITVQVVGDTIDEVDETFFVNLTVPTTRRSGQPGPGHDHRRRRRRALDRQRDGDRGG